MAFFDKVSATLSNMGDSISSATNKAQQSIKTMQAISGLNSQITAQQDAIQAAYLAIGKAYVEGLNGAEPAPEYAEHVAVITNANAAIADMQAQIAVLKGVVTCPSCGGQIPNGSAFCPSCGAKAPEQEVPAAAAEEEAPAFCPNCGSPLEPGAAFCSGCGAKIG